MPGVFQALEMELNKTDEVPAGRWHSGVGEGQKRPQETSAFV